MEYASIVIQLTHKGQEIIYDALSPKHKWKAHQLAIDLSHLFDQVDVLYYEKETDETSSLRAVYTKGMVTKSSNYQLYGRLIVRNKEERGR